jgi:O-antigen/teichoic acid export membrane protein
MALDRYIIKYKYGASRNVVASANMLMIVRGCVLGIILFLSAPVVAGIFNLDHLASVYQWVALPPVIKGFVNLDYAVRQKNLDYTSISLMEAIAHGTSTLLVIPFLYIYESYVVVIFVSVVTMLIYVAVSHYMAVEKYRVAFHKTNAMVAFRFSFPLMINGCLMFFVFQGDKVVVGAFYDMESLGLYAAAFSLFSVPVIFVSRLLTSMFGPLVSLYINNKDTGRLRDVNEAMLKIAASLFSISFVGYSLLGNAVMELIYGADFISDGFLIFWLAVASVTRILREPTSILAIAYGKTHIDLSVNIVRGFGVISAICFASVGFPVEYIALSGVFGEVAAVVLSYAKTWKYFQCENNYGWFFSLLAGVVGMLFLYFAYPHVVFDMALSVSVFFICFLGMGCMLFFINKDDCLSFYEKMRKK